MSANDNIERSATFSECRLYRYSLTRRWAPGALMNWVMLNPSTADAEHDDPTIRRCMAFARRDGYAGIEVRNLFALRSTDPKYLEIALDPVGPNNVYAPVQERDLLHCGWGDRLPKNWRNRVFKLMRNNHFQRNNLQVLGLTKHNQPKHPLYIKGDTPFMTVCCENLEWKP